MGTVQIQICDGKYNIACEDGEEEQLIHLANNFDTRFRYFYNSATNKNKPLSIILAAMHAEDEVHDLKTSKGISKYELEHNLAMADALDAISEYIENLAAKIDEKMNL